MKRFFLFFLLVAVFSCNKLGENPVYDSVFLKLDLEFRDKGLKVPPSYKTFIAGINYNPLYGERLGFGGLLVVNTATNGFWAFDLACPNEQSPNRNTIVEVDKDGIKAICKKCGTEYDVWHGTGMALEGKKYGLRSYHISVTGNSGVVTN